MYLLEIEEKLKKKFEKLKFSDIKHSKAIRKKIEQILENPYHFKPLRKPMNHLRRVHIMKSFVLIYLIDENTKTVFIVDYGHHDTIYKN
ncbi:MAG: type II toxin-antitoxin system mRNA interferase toxin, RelE/StbE family [Candidatus Micrarchaeia archaeon]|jgi:YafQ family addiction module toxin component